MLNSKRINRPKASRHYVVVAHGIGDQKLNTTIPSVVQRFAEVRQKHSKNTYEFVIPASLSSQSVRSETEKLGWSEFRGIPVRLDDLKEDFDGAPPTKTAGENFRFVEMHWQDILQRHQEDFASDLEVWSKAMLDRLQDKAITPEGWLPRWAEPMLDSIARVAVPLKKMLAFKFSPQVKYVANDYMGDVHLYGDYARTRGESVRHFHATLTKLMFYDFLDWRKRELQVSRLNHEALHAEPYQKPEITVIAHSLGSIMCFDALVYAHAKREVREASSESIEFVSSFPFFGYRQPSKEENGVWGKHVSQLERFVKDVDGRLIEMAVYDFIKKHFSDIFEMLDACLRRNGFSEERIDNERTSLFQLLRGEHLVDQWRKAGDNAVIERIANALETQKTPDQDDIIKFAKQACVKDDVALGERIRAIFDGIKNDPLIFAQEIYKNFRDFRDSYWDSFLKGFSVTDCEREDCDRAQFFVQEDTKEPPKINSAVSSSIPFLLWKNCVRNFITIGSPIDKYIALWRQNYKHLGLYKEYDKNFGIGQYDFPSDSDDKIKHYNFCDEQDPVGHHLDMSRKTDVYGHIFSNPEKSDIVYQRYGVPGLAHNMYWEDDDLFKGILEQIIDDSESSVDLTSKEFRLKKNAKKQGFLWAYFRIPLMVSLITSLLITYSMNSMFNKHMFSGVLWLLITLYLWVTPGFSKFFMQRRNPENINKSTLRIFLENLFSKGLFSLLLSVAVKWRRILVVQAEGPKGVCENDNIYLRIQTHEDKLVWVQFLGRWLARFVGAALLLAWLGWLTGSYLPRNSIVNTGWEGLISVLRLWFSEQPIFPYNLFGNLVTNITVFFGLSALVIYLSVLLWELIYFFYIRKTLRT